MRRTLLIPLAFLALAACRDEPSVAERFNAIAGEVENKSRDYEAGAENLVAEEERRLANEAEALFRENANALGNSAEIDANSGEIDLNAH